MLNKEEFRAWLAQLPQDEPVPMPAEKGEGQEWGPIWWCPIDRWAGKRGAWFEAVRDGDKWIDPFIDKLDEVVDWNTSAVSKVLEVFDAVQDNQEVARAGG